MEIIVYVVLPLLILAAVIYLIYAFVQWCIKIITGFCQFFFGTDYGPQNQTGTIVNTVPHQVQTPPSPGIFASVFKPAPYKPWKKPLTLQAELDDVPFEGVTPAQTPVKSQPAVLPLELLNWFNNQTETFRQNLFLSVTEIAKKNPDRVRSEILHDLIAEAYKKTLN
jgi:hypothetical protein